MSNHISQEAMLLLVSCYGGLVLIICYDAIRVLRRVFKASTFRVIVEDIIFWTVASIYIFNILLKYNYGTPRYFVIFVVLITMALYEWFLGRHIIDKVAKVIRKILETFLKPLKKLIKVYKLKLSHKKKESKSHKKIRINVWKKEKHRPQSKEQRDESVKLEEGDFKIEE